MTIDANLPVVALTLGDPGGIGPELIAKLLAHPNVSARANLVLIGDRWLWEAGQRVAGVKVETDRLESLADARSRQATGRPAFVEIDTVELEQVRVGQVCAEGGRSVLSVLDRCMDAALAGNVDAI